jgi:hypothetical protein
MSNHVLSSSIGMYILCQQEEPEDKNLQPVFGLRKSIDLPDQCLAVASVQNLEAWELEPLGDRTVVTTTFAFTEHIIRGSLDEVSRIFFTQDFVVIDAEFLNDGFRIGLLGCWRSQSYANVYLLAYDLGSYDGGITEDKSTFGSSLYIVAGMNVGAVASTGSENQNGSIVDEISQQIFHFGHLYLLWIDNGDHDMPVDSSIRSNYTELAMKHPACSIEEEASAWLKMLTLSMSEVEIEKAFKYAINLCKGKWTTDWMDAHEDNLQGYLRYKRSHG